MRALGAIGALIGCAAVALAAAASHALAVRLDTDDLRRVWIACGIALAHAPVLVAIALHARVGRMLLVASVAITLGTLLFSGSLVARALLGVPSTLAPFGGVLLMAGWLALALGIVRDR